MSNSEQLHHILGSEAASGSVSEHLSNDMNNSKQLPYSFDLHYDLKTEDQLAQEVDHLYNRLQGILDLCRELGYPASEYMCKAMTRYDSAK
jgi:hypothetical protein